ncbi:hypothetical protein [Natrarchaeobaculum aegyptiacum]|uniref:hypothetical protein n=1 Tax=Natrarchaeobaculum aegyptiacum TaxID=745377 RepID=UPI0026CEA469
MTGRRDDHADDPQQAPAEGRPAGDDPRRSTDGAGAPWRDREPTPRRDHAATDRGSSNVTASAGGLVRAGSRVLADALILGLWVVFLTLLFLETNWPRWGFYGLLLGGVTIYVSVTTPWLGTRD